LTRNSRSKSFSVVVSTVPTCDVRNPRVVHQDSDTLFRKESVENFPNLPLVRDIACVRCCQPIPIGDLLRGSFSLLQIDIRDSNRSSVRRESQSDRLPDAAAAAGHDGNFAV